MGQFEDHKNFIPEIRRDGSLISRLIPIVLIGADDVLDRESRLYLRLLCRLVDKSFNEYREAKQCINEEIKSKDRLSHRISIINHLENCVNAIDRAAKIFNLLINGRLMKDKSVIKNNYNIISLISGKTKKKIVKYKTSSVRNRIEHIEEDIYFNKFKNNLFLDVNKSYTEICINKKSILILKLSKMIEDYHKLVIEIYNGLPNRVESGKYYYDKR